MKSKDSNIIKLKPHNRVRYSEVGLYGLPRKEWYRSLVGYVIDIVSLSDRVMVIVEWWGPNCPPFPPFTRMVRQSRLEVIDDEK